MSKRKTQPRPPQPKVQKGIKIDEKIELLKKSAWSTIDIMTYYEICRASAFQIRKNCRRSLLNKNDVLVDDVLRQTNTTYEKEIQRLNILKELKLQ